MRSPSAADPHAGQPVLAAGLPLSQASAVMLLVHGRGASAADILSLGQELDVTGFALLAPQAAGNTWYPQRFLVPRSANQPWLDSALRAVGQAVSHITAAGFPHQRILLLGFSQGACLVLDYAARHPRRYGAVIALSGGLIGASDELPGMQDISNLTDSPGSLAGTPVFLGCSDVDPHIPLERVHHTARALQALGGQVDERIYPNLGHTVNQDELIAVQSLMQSVLPTSAVTS